MKPERNKLFFSVRQAVLSGLVIGALLGVIAETVAQLSAPDAVAAQILPSP